MTHKYILLVDDNIHDVELALSALEEHGLSQNVVVVRDGVEALEYLYHQGQYVDRQNGNPAVILLDLKMPRMDGLEVLAQLKSDSNLKAIPVVMLTSSREESDMHTSYQSGVNAYVVKPVDFMTFVETIKTLGLFWATVNELPTPVHDDLI